MSEITTKIKNNAMISYWFILLNLSFLKSKNPNLNNEFVKSHTKSAIFIHIGFLLNILILIFFNFWDKYSIFGYSVNDIFAIVVFLILFLLLALWVYKAYNKELFSVWKTINFKNNYKILDLTNNWKFSEKDKLTFSFSLIPFIWYIIYPQFSQNKIIKDNVKLNLIITLIIISLYVSGNENMANLLFLVYIIFVVFYLIYIFIQDEIIHINLDFIPDFDKIPVLLSSFKIYLKNYFKNSKEFMNFSKILAFELQKQKQEEISLQKELSQKQDFKLNKYLAYIPVINLITLFNLNTKQKTHIINWLIITILFIVILVLSFFSLVSYKNILFLLFFIFFGIWYLRINNFTYKIPFFHKVFEFLKVSKNRNPKDENILKDKV